MNAVRRKRSWAVGFLSVPDKLCDYDYNLLINPCSFSLFQSMVAFLKDPSGPPLWEENPEAKDVVHIEAEKVSSALSDLVSC